MFRIYELNLQKFAEGAPAGEGDSGVISDNAGQSDTEELFDTGVESTDGETLQDEPDVEESFEELIKGKYKKEYNAKTSAIVQDRVKKMQSTIDKVNPILDMLSSKYGVDVSDVDGILEAVSQDDSYYENEASERGMDVKTLKYVKNLERENEQFARDVREREQNEQNMEAWNNILQQAEELKEIFPSFDLEEEMKNEQFGMLIAANVDVATAYKVLHEKEIQPQMMRYAAQKAENKVANAVRSNTRRPQEGSLSSQPMKVKKNVSNLTDAERDEINRRVMNGEIITL